MTALGCLLPFGLLIAGAVIGALVGGEQGGMIGLIAGFAVGIVLSVGLVWGLAQLERRKEVQRRNDQFL